MSFSTDFSSITGSLTSAFTSVWGAINAPPRIQIPAVPAGQAAGGGVQAGLQKAASTTDVPQTVMYILLGAAGIVLTLALVMIGKKR